jgi:hypothetical protein
VKIRHCLASLAVLSIISLAVGDARGANTTDRSGQISVTITGKIVSALGNIGFTTCSVSAQTVPSSQKSGNVITASNLSSVSVSPSISGGNFSCTVTVPYTWHLDSTAVKVIVSYDILLSAADGSISSSAVSNLAVIPLPADGATTQLSTTVTL